MKVSVIMPSYNRVGLIEETLDSVLNQTYQNWECIVVDDCSSDGTQEVITDYVHKDNRFRFFQRNREPKGAPTCRNIGIEKSVGEYIIFLDSDDLLADYCFENRMKVIEAYPSFDFLVFKTAIFKKTPGDTNYVWNDLSKIQEDLYRFIIHDNPWATAGPIWKRKSIVSMNGFDEDALCWQDWELHIRALMEGLKYIKLDNIAFDNYYRIDYNSNNKAIHKDSIKPEFLANNLHIVEKLFKRYCNMEIKTEVLKAFEIIYFKMFMNAFKNQIIDLVKKVYNSMVENNQLKWKESLLINILLTRFRFLRKYKTRKVLSALYSMDKNKFFNNENSTYIFTKKNELK